MSLRAELCQSLVKGVAGAALLASMALAQSAGPLRAQVASPLQTGHYVPGIANIRDYAAPPPGLFVIGYNWFTSSNSYVDRNGEKFTTLNPSRIDPALPDIDVDVELSGFAAVPALAWASPFTLLGGARYVAVIGPNWATADFSFVADPGGPGSDPSEGAFTEGSVSGMSDLFVAPLGLSWALGQFDATVFYGFTAPTGRYTSGADDNIGLGFWTHQLQGFGYFYPFPDQSSALMAGLTYEVNSEIEDQDVRPGSRLSLEYGISQYLAPWLELGVQGAHNWQVSEDEGSDVFWDPSFFDRKNTLLFSAGFWPVDQRLYVAAKYGFDYAVRQRFDSNHLMLNLIWLPGALDGS
jgi:hypothetical protein